MQAYKFTCPHCRQVGRIHEITHCDGVESEINGFVKERDFYDCNYVDPIGVGDVMDVTYECSECGKELTDCHSLTDLVELGFVTLYDHPPTPDLPVGWSATERGHNMLGRGMDILAYYACGPDAWLEVSYCPENYPATSVATIQRTEQELLDHCNKAVADDGWEWIKNKLG